MAQDIYYNDIVAQLVELRNKIGEGGGGSGEGGGGTIDTSKLEAKLDEVIKAVKEIKVSTDNISVEAGTINLSTDELEGILKETRDYIKNIIGTKEADAPDLHEIIWDIDDQINTIAGKVNTMSLYLRDIKAGIGNTTTPEDGTINKSLLQLKDTATYNADSNFKSSQALTDSIYGKGIADITKELGEYLKTNVGLTLPNKDITILHYLDLLYGLSAILDDRIYELNNNTSNIGDRIGDINNPIDGTVIKSLNELKTFIAPNSDVTVETVINKLKAIMTNDTAIANAQLTVGANQHTELLDAINSGTLATYLQDIIGPREADTNTLYELIDNIDTNAQKINTSVTNIKSLDATRNSMLTSIRNALYTVSDGDSVLIQLNNLVNIFNSSTVIPGKKTITEFLESVLTYNNNTIGNIIGLTRFSIDNIKTNTDDIETSIGRVADDSDERGSIHAKLRYLSTRIRDIFADNNNVPMINYITSISKNTNRIDEIIGNAIDTAKADGSINSKLRYLIKTLESTLISDNAVPLTTYVKSLSTSIGNSTDDSNANGSIHAKFRSLHSIIGSMGIVLNELGNFINKHHEEIKEAISFQNSILNDNFNPPIHDYTIRIVSNLKLDLTTEFRLTNTVPTSNSPQNIDKDYISLPLNKTLYLNYTDFTSTYHAYFYVNGQNTKIPGNIKILNEDRRTVDNGGGSYEQGIAPKGSGGDLQGKSIYIILT